MSKSDVGLAAFVVRQLEDAVTKKPCARCGGDHELTKCPMGPNQGYKGILWKGWSQLIRDKADAWVKGRDDYNPPAIAPKKVATSTRTIPSRGGGTGAATATSTDVKKRVPWTAVHDYRNTVTTTEMHYPAPQGIASDLPIGDGMTWILPSQMGKRSKLLRLKDDAKYALRADFFPNNGKTVILTNHFEYNLNTNEFYEYKILDLGTKNRKKLKALISSAINNWPFLQQNQTSFTTNWIDTIVAWKSLHDDLKDGTDVENGAIEWGPHSIPLGNNAVTTRFKFVKIINTHGLHQYAAANPSYEHYNFDDIARCLNIVISKSFGAPVHKVSSNKFFVKNARNGLWNNTTNHPSNSLEIIRGYHYNVKPGMGNIILNFNISTSAVFRPILVSEFMTDPETFNADRLTHILMGKTVYIHLSRKNNDQAKQDRLNSEESRYWKILELQQSGSIEDLRFRKKIVHNGQFLTNPDGSYQFEATETRVTDHLTQVFGQAPAKGIPAVNVGSRLHPVWYAQEFLRLVPYQPYTRPVPDSYTSSMVDQACRDPAVSRAYIEREGLGSLGFTTSADTTAFGSNVPISLVPTMLQVPHYTMEFPQARYSDGSTPGKVSAQKQSGWKFPGQAKTFLFTNPNRLGNFRYAIILGPKVYTNQGDRIQTRIQSQIDKCGFAAAQAIRVPSATLDIPLKSTTSAAIETKLKEAESKGANLIILLLQAHGVPAYRNFKNLTDRRFGMHSICMTLKSGREEEMTTNVMMKMNLKFGGTNHGIEPLRNWLTTTMVIGADLVHPGPGSYPGTPSIAAVVGSIDPFAGTCLGSLRLQDVHKTDREIMDEKSLRATVAERLMAWTCYRRDHGNELPDNIIYFRDGVSSGHYDKVKDVEHRAIRDAYAEARTQAGLKPKKLSLTSVIVTKRHHTRFYPRKKADGDRWGNSNTHPGTCVDKLVTSPYYQDFFLQSHSGIKGTAKPTHYFVLQNEVPKLRLESLRNIIHNLCYSYVRTMGGVSYVSPTYYADRLCERGRLYLRKYFIGDDDDLWNDFAAEKREREKAFRVSRESIYGAKEHKKSDAERKLERDHADRIATGMKDWMLTKIEDDFYIFKNDPDPQKRWDNPFSRRLAGTMFWM